MKTCNQMQRTIEAIAQKHGVDLTQDGAHLKLELDGYMPLVIENLWDDKVSVTHYYEQNGDLCPDPDILFFTGYGEWVPVQITQPSGYQQVTWLARNDYGRLEVDKFHPQAQRDVGGFANQWGRNIKMQGWLEHGAVSEP